MGGVTALEARSIRFSYPGTDHGLRDFNLSVPENEKWALIGPNGAGKSTLLLLADGLLKPDSGEILLFGVAPTGNSQGEIARKRAGIVFQNADDQVFCPTVFEDVVFGPLNHDLSPEEAHDRAHVALHQVGLDGYEDRVPQHLSGGEKRKVALATVLAMKPDLLLFDEPTTGLDPKGRQELFEILEAAPGTLLIATHDFELVLRTCDKAALLNGGSCVRTGTPEEILFDRSLLEANDLVQPSWLPYLPRNHPASKSSGAA